MRTKVIILTLLFAVSALLAVICYDRTKTTDLNDAQGTLPFDVEEYVDPRSVTLRGRRALDPQEVAALPGNNEFATTDGQMDNVILPKVSYVTSFWAQERGTEANPHRLEIRASLLANILNPHFDQVVIFLDSVKENANCDLFLRGMKELSRTLNISSFPTTSVNHDDLHSKVTCVGSPHGQPTYYQMFKNAVSDYVTGDIVVMANADQAFDDTMALARHLNPEVLLNLGTRGYSADKISPDVDLIYKQVVGRVHPEYMIASNEREKAPDNCMTIPGSIDTWIFHKSKLKHALRPEPFQRRNRGGRMEFFFMNELGAENAAIWALNQCYQFQSYYNACEKIRSWHLHLTPKTHHRNVRVRPPWNPPFPSKTPRCVFEENCFL